MSKILHWRLAVQRPTRKEDDCRSFEWRKSYNHDRRNEVEDEQDSRQSSKQEVGFAKQVLE